MDGDLLPSVSGLTPLPPPADGREPVTRWSSDLGGDSSRSWWRKIIIVMVVGQSLARVKVGKQKLGPIQLKLVTLTRLQEEINIQVFDFFLGMSRI